MRKQHHIRQSTRALTLRIKRVHHCEATVYRNVGIVTGGEIGVETRKRIFVHTSVSCLLETKPLTPLQPLVLERPPGTFSFGE